MPRGRFKGVNRTSTPLANGTKVLRKYHRKTGILLPLDETSREFAIAWAEAEKLVTVRRIGDNFIGLMREYLGSPEVQKLAPATLREYKRMLTKAEPEFGDMPRDVLNDPDVRRLFMKWRAEVSRTSGEREADNRLSAISAMLTWGIDNWSLKANHLKGFKRLYHVDRSEIIWLPEHIQAFMRVAPVEMQLAMIVALHTGQRQGDILKMPWSAYDGTHIKVRQGKSVRKGVPGKVERIKCTDTLRRALNSLERRSTIILTTKTGQSFKKRYFARLWDEAMKAAGLESVTMPDMDEPVRLHFHDIRGTAITMLSIAGCSTPLIASVTGHTLKSVDVILERYLAKTSHLSDQAIDRLQNSPRTDFANRLQIAPPVTEPKKGKSLG